MSDNDFFAPPAFKPDEALPMLKRQLRDLRLAERGNSFESKGQSIVSLAPSETSIDARLVKRPARTPEWTTHTLKSSADVRRFVETVRRQLAAWGDVE